EVRRVFVVVSPRFDIADLELHRNTYREQINRWTLLAIDGIRGAWVPVRHQQVEFVFNVGHSPQHRRLVLLAFVVGISYVETLDFRGAVPVNTVNWPGQFHMQARLQDIACRFSESLAQS